MAKTKTKEKKVSEGPTKSSQIAFQRWQKDSSKRMAEFGLTTKKAKKAKKDKALRPTFALTDEALNHLLKELTPPKLGAGSKVG